MVFVGIENRPFDAILRQPLFPFLDFLLRFFGQEVFDSRIALLINFTFAGK